MSAWASSACQAGLLQTEMWLSLSLVNGHHVVAAAATADVAALRLPVPHRWIEPRSVRGSCDARRASHLPIGAVIGTYVHMVCS